MTFNCPKCSEEISLDEYFKDKAAENELKTATIKCTNQDCPWEGLGKFYMVAIHADLIDITLLSEINLAIGLCHIKLLV